MNSPQPLSILAHRVDESPISTLMQAALANPALISLAAGFVDQATLPAGIAARAAVEVLRDPIEGRRALQYGTTLGDPGLRRRLIERLEREEGAPPGAFAEVLPRTVVTTGSQQLLYLLAEVLLDPDDIVIVEAPTYFVYLGVLGTRGARVVSIETDEGGMKLDALEDALTAIEDRGELDRVKLIYTISEHGNPSGLSLAANRRGDLVALARRWSKHRTIYILEDAAYRGLTFRGDDPPSVWGHDLGGDTVILARTFSKTFSPGMKIGYGVVPDALIDPLLIVKGSHDFGSANFNQVVLERVLAEGAYEAHVETLVETYRRKCEITLEALRDHFTSFEGAVEWTRPRGGIYVWMTMPEGIDTGRDGPYFARCVAEGVLYVPGAYAFPDSLEHPAPTRHLRLCFGVPGETEIREGVRRMAVALESCLAAVG